MSKVISCEPIKGHAYEHWVYNLKFSKHYSCLIQSMPYIYFLCVCRVHNWCKFSSNQRRRIYMFKYKWFLLKEYVFVKLLFTFVNWTYVELCQIDWLSIRKIFTFLTKPSLNFNSSFRIPDNTLIWKLLEENMQGK